MPTDQPQPEPRFALTREVLLQGGLGERLRAANPDVRLLTDEEREANLAALLAQRPDGDGGVYVFAYGSLIWNPAIHITGRVLCRARGWHRAFCLATKGGRGTAETPGMLLGLMEGGDCVGAVLHVAEDDVRQELSLLWRREMVADGYIPRWVAVETLDGTQLGEAIAFTINPAGPSYCPPLPEAELVRRIAVARGQLGTAAEYLFRTRDGLRGLGIQDEMLERLGAAVTDYQRSHGMIEAADPQNPTQP
jgi:cation transport protein ChaC